MAAEEQIWFKAEGDEQDIPDELAAFITDLEVFAHILYRGGRDLLHPIEESLQRVERSFLGLIARVHLGKSLWFTVVAVDSILEMLVRLVGIRVFALLILLDYLLQFSDYNCIFLPNEVQGQLALNIEEVLS